MADESSSLGAAHLDDFWDLHRRLGERYELLLKELRRAKVDGCSALTNSHANSQTPSSRVQIPDDDLPLLDPAESMPVGKAVTTPQSHGDPQNYMLRLTSALAHCGAPPQVMDAVGPLFRELIEKNSRLQARLESSDSTSCLAISWQRSLQCLPDCTDGCVNAAKYFHHIRCPHYRSRKVIELGEQQQDLGMALQFGGELPEVRSFWGTEGEWQPGDSIVALNKKPLFGMAHEEIQRLLHKRPLTVEVLRAKASSSSSSSA
ncbi:unnamed protein product [Durusdinium trenchii]|uniref:PDZ domain-containing protein n=1 Tax=Durusdinium trenchii TaxID=1381693 RepID=A0ABP0RV78_9DINO